MLKPLSKSEIKELNQKINEQFEQENFFDKKDKVVLKKDHGEKSILKDGKEQFFYISDRLIPNLKIIQENNFLKKIIVDMGAIKFVTNGADVMRPGVKEIDETIKEGEVICVVDETHGKPLAICKTLFDAAEMKEKDSGKVLQNLHYIGDKRWKTS